MSGTRVSERARSDERVARNHAPRGDALSREFFFGCSTRPFSSKSPTDIDVEAYKGWVPAREALADLAADERSEEVT
jgi:hypothetical protein